MYEVFMRLRFDSPCLGNVRTVDENGTPTLMARGPDGGVSFSQTWWRTIVCQAAESYGKHQNRVKSILWTPSVDGTPKMFRRFYAVKDAQGTLHKMYTDHEAFLVGDVIGVKALVPDDVPLEDLRDLMRIAGEYFGISPFGWKKGYGKFKIQAATRITKVKEETDGNGDTDRQGQHDVDPAGNAGCESGGDQADNVSAPPAGELGV